MNLKTRLMWSGAFFSRFFSIPLFNESLKVVAIHFTKCYLKNSRCCSFAIKFVPQTLPLFRGTFVKANLDFFPNICHPTKCFLWSFYFGVFLWIHDLLIRSTWPTTWWGRLVGQSYPINQHATPRETSFMLKVTILTCQRWPNFEDPKTTPAKKQVHSPFHWRTLRDS